MVSNPVGMPLKLCSSFGMQAEGMGWHPNIVQATCCGWAVAAGLCMRW